MRHVGYIGAPSQLRDKRAALMRQQNMTATLLDPGCAQGAPSVDVMVIDGSGLPPGVLETELERLEASGNVMLAIFPPDRVPAYKRRAALIAAGASDTMQASASEDEFMTRVRALVLRRAAPQVLVVEDEADIATWVCAELARGGMEGASASTLADARAAFQRGPVDALVIDRMLPDGDGIAFLRELRASEIRTPALLFTALNQDFERVEGLKSGADDYIGKPVHADELRARVALLLRPKLRDDVLIIGPLEVARADALIRWRGSRVELRPREYELLIYLVEREGLSIPQKMLLEDVWGRTAVSPEANPVTQTRYRLGKALRAAGLPSDIIVTDEDCYRFESSPLLRVDAGGDEGGS